LKIVDVNLDCKIGPLDYCETFKTGQGKILSPRDLNPSASIPALPDSQTDKPLGRFPAGGQVASEQRVCKRPVGVWTGLGQIESYFNDAPSWDLVHPAAQGIV
jgi:hypothetical protein